MLLSFGVLLNLLVVVICEQDVVSGQHGFLWLTGMILIIRTKRVTGTLGMGQGESR